MTTSSFTLRTVFSRGVHFQIFSQDFARNLGQKIQNAHPEQMSDNFFFPVSIVSKVVPEYGYVSDKLQLDLIDRNSSKSIKSGIQMHDVCANYLKWENSGKK